MHYSFRNTLCGLAVVIAAGLLADQAAAQTVTLLEDDDTISLSPADEGSSAPEEISLFDEQMGDVSLPGGDGLLSPSQPTDSVATDVIPMEGSTDDNSSEQISIAVENGARPKRTGGQRRPQHDDRRRSAGSKNRFGYAADSGADGNRKAPRSGSHRRF